MVESMTGFGRGDSRQDGISADVEIRSVNNRFCDVSVRLPRFMGDFEYEVQQIVKREVGRGKINVHIRIEQQSQTSPILHVDTELVATYRELLNQLREAAEIKEDVKLEHVLTFSDVFARPDEDDDESSRAWAVAKTALAAALKAFKTMRRREGTALAADLESRLDMMTSTLAEVAERAPSRVIEAADKLRARIASLIEDPQIDETRLATEIAMLADRLDITEECVRLDAHISAFRDALHESESTGRKLNFLTQEIHREVNTIGSKANDFAITQQSVQLKEELEKIREQVQNIQ